MEAFPAFFPLAGRRVVIAGEGEGAEAKARLFESSPAAVEHLTGDAALLPEAYVGAVLAFVASPDAAFRQAAAAAARAGHVPVNVVDDAALSDFHTPAMIDRGQVVVAIGTGGAAPILASLMRGELETQVPEGAGRVAALLQKFQPQVRGAFPDLPARRAFLRAALDGPAAAAARVGNMDTAAALFAAQIAGGGSAVGAIRLVVQGARADLLTLRAARALAVSDILVSAADADPQVLALARRDASRMALEDLSEEALVQLAREGRQVTVVADPDKAVRLTAALRGLGVSVERLDPAEGA